MKTLIAIPDASVRDLLIQPETVALIKTVSQVDYIASGNGYDSGKLAREIGGYDAVITGWGTPRLTEEVWGRADKLAFIGHTAGTLHNLLDEEAFRRGVTVVNANAALARSTAEATVAMMMAGAWELHAFNESTKQGEWRHHNEMTVPGLAGQSIGLIGIGQVAREVIRLLAPYDADIRVCSRYLSEEEAKTLGVIKCGLEETIRSSRIVSLHDTLTAETRGMIGAEQLSWLPDGALFVNTARAGIVDEAALIEAARSGRIRIALDVFHNEPPGAEADWLRLPNVAGYPHIGAFSGYWKRRQGHLAAQDLVKFAHGETPDRVIDLTLFRRMSAH